MSIRVCSLKLQYVALMGFSGISAIQQALRTLLWMTHPNELVLFMSNEIKTAVLDVALLLMFSNPAEGPVCIVRSTLT